MRAASYFQAESQEEDRHIAVFLRCAKTYNRFLADDVHLETGLEVSLCLSVCSTVPLKD